MSDIARAREALEQDPTAQPISIGALMQLAEAYNTITRLRAELAEAREGVKSLLDEIAKAPDADHLLDTTAAGSAFEFLAKTN